MNRDEVMALVYLHKVSTNDQERQEIETRVRELWQNGLASYAEITALSIEHTEEKPKIVYSLRLNGKVQSCVVNV